MIHFRSRISNQQIKPIVDTTGSGWCCSTSSIVANRSLCQGGFFILGGTNNTFCPQTAQCDSGFIGSNGACCYWSLVNKTYTQVCENVNSAIECADKNAGESEGLYPTFTLGGSCVEQGGDIVCNGAQNLNAQQETVDSRLSEVTPDVVIGHCCGENTCKKTIEDKCPDTWIPPDITQLYSCDSGICMGIARSMTANPRVPPSITTYELNNTTNELEKTPQIGQYYQGGIYVGTFNTAKNNESFVFGNTNTGDGNVYRARNSALYYPGTQKWILIADDVDLELQLPYNDTDESSTNLNISFSDGLYNTENNPETKLLKYIKNYKKNGFQDWYLPSQDELAFYFNNIKADNNVYKNANLADGLYLSSTGYKIGNTQLLQTKYYNYAQTASIADGYGRVSLISRNAPVKIRLFRRINVLDLNLTGAQTFPKIPGPYKIFPVWLPGDGEGGRPVIYPKPILRGEYKNLSDCLQHVFQKLLSYQKILTNTYNTEKQKIEADRLVCIANGESNCNDIYAQKMNQLKQDFYEDWARLRDDYQVDVQNCKNSFKEIN